PRAAAPPAAEAPRSDRRRSEPRAHDPIRDYRGLRGIRAALRQGSAVPDRPDPRRRDRDDDGESFIGFGPEGVPDFLRFKATLER
ncbi:hypothetical protein IP88_09325, partial [alpha proteobacterium AAP81b]